MPNGKVDEGEIALIIGEGGLKKATLARRKRIRAHFQAFTMENYQKDLADLINGPKEDLGKAVCAFLSTLCVNKRQPDLKMAQELPKQNTLEMNKSNLRQIIMMESDGQLDIYNKAHFNQVTSLGFCQGGEIKLPQDFLFISPQINI